MVKVLLSLNNPYMLRVVKIICLLLFVCNLSLKAQSVLSRKISLNIQKQKLSKVLSGIEEKGNFRFSFNSKILPLDSLVSINQNDLNIAEALDVILNHGYEYRQAGNFVIIRYAPLELLLMIKESVGNSELYSITGQIVDKNTGKPVPNASIYERNLLLTQLSDSEGNFSLRLKDINQPIALVISKENYKSLTNYFLTEVNISQSKERASDKTKASFYDEDFGDIENTKLGRSLITATQRIQSLNIGGLISNAPIQLALVPGINSHGSLSGQIVNKFSFNAVGAYSAGVDGAEIGLIFNIDKTNVQYFQFAGGFNLVGGNVKGLQIAGFFNHNYGNFDGVQTSVGFNRIGKDLQGVQIGGGYNRINGNLRGIQISAGLNSIGGKLKGIQLATLNQVAKDSKGMQIAALANIVSKKSNGVQIAGFLNYAKQVRGLQVGIVNISDTNEGYSLGLINIAFKGYHKIGFSTNESLPYNFIYKGGSKKLYNLLLFGFDNNASAKLYSGGLGFGTEIKLFNQLAINPEVTAQYVYQGNWSDTNLLSKLELPINIKITKGFAIQGGPSLNIYRTAQKEAIGNYRLLQEKHKDFSFANPNYTGWIGWSLGVLIF